MVIHKPHIDNYEGDELLFPQFKAEFDTFGSTRNVFGKF